MLVLLVCGVELCGFRLGFIDELLGVLGLVVNCLVA